VNVKMTRIELLTGWSGGACELLGYNELISANFLVINTLLYRYVRALMRHK
jgi:hypothetical protein